MTASFAFLDFCHEVLHNILSETEPADLAQLAQTCKSLRNYIYPNPLLWQHVYLKHFDEPSQEIVDANGRSTFWQYELQAYAKLQKTLQSQRREIKEEALVPCAQTITSLIKTAVPSHAVPSRNRTFLATHFEDQANIDTLLFSSSLYEYCGSTANRPAKTTPARQLSAKLHCLFGTSQDIIDKKDGEIAHPWARSRVYDLRRYNDGNQWGPFMDDGSFDTDWEKVECIMVVLGHSIDAFRHRCAAGLCGFNNIWDEPFGGVTPKSFVSPARAASLGKYAPASPMSTSPRYADDDIHTLLDSIFPPATSPAAESAKLIPQPSPSLESQDPYGVTGTWNRVVAFLDYTDFYNFNFSDRNPDPEADPRIMYIDPDIERGPITTQEAVRFISIKWRVVKIEAPGEDDGQDLPVVKFKGFSRSMHSAWDPNANSKIIGSVRMTKEGEVRWTTLSIFHG